MQLDILTGGLSVKEHRSQWNIKYIKWSKLQANIVIVNSLIVFPYPRVLHSSYYLLITIYVFLHVHMPVLRKPPAAYRVLFLGASTKKLDYLCIHYEIVIQARDMTAITRYLFPAHLQLLSDTRGDIWSQWKIDLCNVQNVYMMADIIELST